MENSARTVVLLGTLDTKREEMDYLRARLEDLGCTVRVQDLSLASFTPETDMSGESKIRAMENAAAAALDGLLPLAAAGRLAGAVGMGGGVGTWLACRILGRLPYGIAKVVVSTLPFDPRSAVAGTDIVVVPSVVDILGLNPILRGALHRAAAIVAGLTANPPSPDPAAFPVVGLTALGVTTPAAENLRRLIEKQGFEAATFHANGPGDDAFESFIERRAFAGVLDLTTSVLGSQLFHGVATTTRPRLEAAGRSGTAQVVVPGGLSFISRGPLEALTPEDRARPHYRQNYMFTHVRLTAGEMRQIGEVMADKLNAATGPTAVAIPLGGFSSEDRKGGAIFDPSGNRALIDVLKSRLRSHIGLVEVNAHINSEEFAAAAFSLLLKLLPETLHAKESTDGPTGHSR